MRACDDRAVIRVESHQLFCSETKRGKMKNVSRNVYSPATRQSWKSLSASTVRSGLARCACPGLRRYLHNGGERNIKMLYSTSVGRMLYGNDGKNGPRGKRGREGHRLAAGSGGEARRNRNERIAYFFYLNLNRSTDGCLHNCFPHIPLNSPSTMAPVAASPTPVVAPLPAIPPTAAAKDKAATRKRFEAVYTVVRDDLLADFRKHNMPEESIEYYRRVRIHTHMYGFSYALVLTARDRAWTTTSQVENSTAV